MFRVVGSMTSANLNAGEAERRAGPSRGVVFYSVDTAAIVIANPSRADSTGLRGLRNEDTCSSARLPGDPWLS